MHTCLVILLSALHVAIPAAKDNSPSFISGGNNATNSTQFPYHVSILLGDQDNYLFMCSGAIIDTTHVVTSASALGSTNIRNLIIDYGSNVQMGSDVGPIYIKSCTIHDGYSNISFVNDISLIELDTPFNFSSSSKPVNISTNWTEDTSEECTISYFMDTNLDEEDNLLLEWAFVSILNCSGELKPNESLFCAGDNTSRNQTITSEYRGSPLVCNSKLVGIVTNSSSGYLTDITKYYDWILNIISPPTTVQPSNSSATKPTSNDTTINTTKQADVNTTTVPPSSNSTTNPISSSTTTIAPNQTDENSLSNNIIFYSVIVLVVVISIGLVFIIVKCLLAQL